VYGELIHGHCFEDGGVQYRVRHSEGTRNVRSVLGTLLNRFDCDGADFNQTEVAALALLIFI
jgi:hypothetical protein